MMDSSELKEPLRVAIVGSGMAGLVTAYLLNRDSRQRYVVKVFESGSTLSLDSASLSIPNASKTSSDRVDLPMRAFAGGYYSNLKAMYDHLGVKYRSQPFLFEFARTQAAPASRKRGGQDISHFVHASNLHQTPPPRPTGVSTAAYLVEVAYLIFCYAWLSLCCFFVVPTEGPGLPETLDHYLKRIRLPVYFVNFYVLPLISGVTTCPHKSLLAFPASDVIEYKRRTHRAPHYTVSNGVKTVQDQLVRGIDYELSAGVSAVEVQGGKVKLSWTTTIGGRKHGREGVFDKVVLAVAPDVVGEIFEPAKRYMQRIPTTLVESVVHTDRNVLGDSRMPDQSSVNRAQLIYLRTATEGVKQTESLHVQPSGAIVTTCPFSPIDSSRTLHAAKFTRVLRSPESKRIVNRIFGDTLDFTGDEKSPSWRNGDDSVFLAGGWCWDGMVLLEGCIVSAMRIADALGVDIPWRA